MPNPNPPSQPSNNKPAPSDKSKPIEKRYQNYLNLRNQILSKFKELATEQMDKSFPLDFRQQQTNKTAAIVAARSITLLPKEAVTQENLTTAIVDAIEELANNKFWYDLILPEGKQRKELAKKIAGSFEVSSANLLIRQQITNLERHLYAQDKLNEIPDEEATLNQIQQNLQNELQQHFQEDLQKEYEKDDLSPEEIQQKAREESQKIASQKSKNITNQSLTNIESQAIHNGTSPSREYIEDVFAQSLDEHAGEINEEKRSQIAKKVTEQSQETITARSEAIGHNAETIAKSASLKGKIFKRSIKDNRFGKIGKTFTILDTIRHPVKSTTRVIKRKIFRLLGKRTLKFLTKLGLKSAVKFVEIAALEISTAGAATPLLILKEIVSRGIGNIGKTVKGLWKDTKKIAEDIRQGKPIRGAVRTLGLVTDSALAGVGSIVGGGVGATAGALLGTLLGSIIPIIGNIAGGIIGGLAGGAAGAGYGAKKGYKFRRKLVKKLKIFLFLKLIDLPGLLQAAIKALITKAIIIPAQQLAFIVKYYTLKGLVQAATSAQQLVSIAKYHTFKALTQAATSAKQLAFIAKHYVLKIGEPIGQFLKNVVNLANKIPSGILKALKIPTTTISDISLKSVSKIGEISRTISKAGTLAKSLPVSEGFIAKTLVKSGSLLKQIPHAAAKTLNSLVPVSTNAVVKSAAKITEIIGKITTDGVSTTLTAMPVYAITTVASLSIITMTVLIAAFYVHPTDVDQYVGPYGPRFPLPWGEVIFPYGQDCDPYNPYDPYDPYGPYGDCDPYGPPGPFPTWPVGNIPPGCPSGWPLSGYITQGIHGGGESIDIGAAAETPIHATSKGKAIKAYDTTYGFYVDVFSNCEGKTIKIRYAHMPRFGYQGNVNKGQVIGVVDSTGHSSGNHLHYGFYGIPMSPPYIPQYIGHCDTSEECGNISF